MTTFDNREQNFEAAFAHDQELQFLVYSRCVKMLGRWAAQEIGLTGAKVEEYIHRLLEIDLKQKGLDDVLGALAQDFAQKKKAVIPATLRAKRDEFLKKAKAEIMADL